MKKWHRFDDDDIAEIGNHTLKFDFPNGNYTLTVKQLRQNSVDVVYGEKTEAWPVEVKEQNGPEFKLSGFAWATPEIGLEDCWFELHICPTPKITYWGDRVVIRTDLCCSSQ